MFGTKRPAWRITLSALPILPLLLTLTLAPALAQEGVHDYCTIKYKPDGDEIWHQANDSGNWNFAYGVAVDLRDNRVIVTGASEIWHDYDEDGEEDEGEVNYDYWTIKYDSEGNEVWHVTYDSGGREEAFAVAVDSEGNIIVAGRSSDDFCLIKYNADGKEIWDEPVIYDGGNEDGANSVAVDSKDNIVVTGYSSDGTTLNYCTVKYDPDGKEIWAEPVIYDSGNEDGALEVAVDSKDDSIIITGSSDIWHDYDHDEAEDEGEKNPDYCTLKYNPDGTPFTGWATNPVIYDSTYNDVAYGATVDSNGNVVVTGAAGRELDEPERGYYYTIKYNGADGNVVEGWPVTYDTGHNDAAYGAAVDSEDNVIITGSPHTPGHAKQTNGISVTPPVYYSYTTIKYAPDGGQLWVKNYDLDDQDSALDVAVDSKDNIIVAGWFQIYAEPDGDGDIPADSGGLPTIAIIGIALGGCAAVGLAYYYLIYLREKPLPRGERRRRAAKQRKKAA